MDIESPLRVVLSGGSRLELSAVFGGGRLAIHDNQNAVAAELVAALSAAVLGLGGSQFDGTVRIKNAAGLVTIQVSGRDQSITLFDANGDQTIMIDGAIGDIKLTGGDAAEEFEFAEDSDPPPGSVVVVGQDGLLRESTEPFDHRVAGVISGAGAVRPGIVLGSGPGGRRRPIALAGRVECLVDTTLGPILAGDLLASSYVPGHAMAAVGRSRAQGTIVGKALMPMSSGSGLLPVLVTLQ